MKNVSTIVSIASVAALLAFWGCSTQEEMPAKPAPAEKAPAKAKVEKASGDIGLLDTEKNYMILVTKEGKLITLDFDQRTKVTKITPTNVKAADVGLGSSATVTYEKANDKNIATKLDYRPAKGGD